MPPASVAVNSFERVDELSTSPKEWASSKTSYLSGAGVGELGFDQVTVNVSSPLTFSVSAKLNASAGSTKQLKV